MPKFDDEQIGFIGGESVAWPAEGQPEYADHWRLMHKAVRHLREVVTATDPRLQAVETNRDLAEEGLTRQLNAVGREAIQRVDECTALETARQGIAARMTRIDAEMQAHARPPEEPADIALAGEIRAALRGMSPAERMRFIRGNLQQPGLAGAVTSAAGFLSGMSATEQAEVRNMVAETLYAPQVAERALLTRALRELEVARGRAHTLIAGRARLARNHHNEWAMRPPTGGPVQQPMAAGPGSAFAAR